MACLIPEPHNLRAPGVGSQVFTRIRQEEAKGLGGDCGQQRRQVPATPARNKGSEWPDLALYKKEVEDVYLYVKSVDF